MARIKQWAKRSDQSPPHSPKYTPSPMVKDELFSDEDTASVEPTNDHEIKVEPTRLTPTIEQLVLFRKQINKFEVINGQVDSMLQRLAGLMTILTTMQRENNKMIEEFNEPCYHPKRKRGRHTHTH